MQIQTNLTLHRVKIIILVMDGGALLHRVCWVKGSNFKKIAKSYVQYVRKHYGKCYIVFDGYESASTKSVEQKRWDKSFQKCPDVDVKEDIIVPFTQEKFLSNTSNKVQLIKMLSQYLKDDGNEVINCSGDADSTLCHTAMDLATTGEKEVVLIADDMNTTSAPYGKGKKSFLNQIKDVTVFVNDDARYMARPELGWGGCSQMLCRDVHFWEKMMKL